MITKEIDPLFKTTVGFSGAVVYALCCPESGEVRYIGRTTTPYFRYWAHCHDETKTHRGSWIRSLSAPPIAIVLEKCSRSNASAREKYHIHKALSEGTRLVNHTDGGEVYQASPTLRALWSKQRRGKKRSPEVGRKISRSLKRAFQENPEKFAYRKKPRGTRRKKV